MNNEVKLEIVLNEDAEKIMNIMVEIRDNETLRWFKNGNEPFIPGYNSIDMQRYHTWDNKYYKILYNENIIGVALISHTGREHARIDRLYMLPEYQGLSIGSTVLKLIENLFPMVKVWTLDTIQESPRNHHFYEKKPTPLYSVCEGMFLPPVPTYNLEKNNVDKSVDSLLPTFLILRKNKKVPT